MLQVARVYPAVMAGILIVNSLPAQSSPSGLHEAVYVDLPKADVAILLDASGSMGSTYPAVRQAAVDFGASLTARETLHMRAFSSVPTVALEGTGDVAGPRAPQSLPDQPLPGGTDLGLAIDKALEFFERPGAAPLQALFLLTDGRHQPPAGSPFPRDFEHSNWKALRVRAHELAARRTVLVYGFGLQQQTDVALLARVFPATNVEIVVGGVSSVPQVLEQMRQRLKERQILLALQEDIGSGVVTALAIPPALTSRDPNAKVRIVMRNGYRHLAVKLAGLSLRASPESHALVSAHIQMRVPLVLKPGDSVETIADVRMPSAGRNGFVIGRREDVYTSSFRVEIRGSFTDTEELRNMGIADTTPRFDVKPWTVEFRLSHGVSYWLVLLAGVVFGGGGAVIWHRRGMEKQREYRIALERERLLIPAGQVRVWKAGEPEPDAMGWDLASLHTKELALCLTEQGQMELSSSGEVRGPDQFATIKCVLGPASSTEPLGRAQCEIEVEDSHVLTYESGGAMRQAGASLTLYDRDLLEIDGQWRLRYSNSKLRRRYDVESSRK